MERLPTEVAMVEHTSKYTHIQLPVAVAQEGREHMYRIIVETRSLTARDLPGPLPAELAPFTRTSQVQFPDMPAPTTIAAHHGGSHLHLVNEFVRSIVAGRAPFVDAARAAEWTAKGSVRTSPR